MPRQIHEIQRNPADLPPPNDVQNAERALAGHGASIE